MRSGACKQIEIMAQHFLDGSEMWNGVPHFGTVQVSLPVAYHFFNLSSLGGCGANRQLAMSSQPTSWFTYARKKTMTGLASPSMVKACQPALLSKSLGQPFGHFQRPTSPTPVTWRSPP